MQLKALTVDFHEPQRQPKHLIASPTLREVRFTRRRNVRRRDTAKRKPPGGWGCAEDVERDVGEASRRPLSTWLGRRMTLFWIGCTILLNIALIYIYLLVDWLGAWYE